MLLEVSGSRIHMTSLEKMDFHRIKWLDLENPSDEELTKVSEIVRLPKHELTESFAREEMARVAELEHFSVVVVKSPLVINHQKGLSATSITCFISERLLITLHKDSVGTIKELQSLPEHELLAVLQKGTSELLYTLFEKIINDFFVVLDNVEDQINKVEDTVFSKPDVKTVKQIFALKRTLIYFHKALSANRDVLVNLQRPELGVQIKDKVQRRITHFYYDVVQLIDVVATYRDILTGALDIYLSAVSNNMNVVMKQMTAYGSLVLVPTFIAGLYGMNFRYMPEIGWRYGYLFAWVLMIGSMTALYVYFKRKDWF